MFVDAEQTYFQAGISQLILEMQREFNCHRPTVLNTYQEILNAASYQNLFEIFWITDISWS